MFALLGVEGDPNNPGVAGVDVPPNKLVPALPGVATLLAAPGVPPPNEKPLVPAPGVDGVAGKGAGPGVDPANSENEDWPGVDGAPNNELVDGVPGVYGTVVFDPHVTIVPTAPPDS